jgi:hypothetical protein
LNRSAVAFSAAIVVLLAVILVQFLQYGSTTIRIAFAAEQTETFEQMVAKASTSLRQSPPDTRGAVGCLRYARWYYPSGTKQTEGSRLDQIVERCRGLAEARIIQMLREATGKDLGDDAEHWISMFGDESPNE